MREPQVSTRIGALIIHAAAAHGVDPGRLTALAGANPRLLGDLDGRMPLALEERLWEVAAAETGDPLFGLHAAERIRPGAFDVLDYAVRTAPDLRAALDRLARYNRLVHDLASFEIRHGADSTRIEHRFSHPSLAPSHHAVDFTLGSLVVVAAQISGRPVVAEAVEFRHAALGPKHDYARVFGVTPRFGATASALTLGEEVLHRPSPGADAGLSRIVTAHADQLLSRLQPASLGMAAQVSRHVVDGMAHGAVSLGDVARNLNMSARSLQRRLDAEGARFGALVDEVRRELVLRYIADPRLALGEVAYLLGFAEPSPFHRAFRRWTGTTPSAARRALQ